MKEIWNWTQLGIATVGGWLGYFLGGWDGFLYALVAFVIIDYTTGYANQMIMKIKFLDTG